MRRDIVELLRYSCITFPVKSNASSRIICHCGSRRSQTVHTPGRLPALGLKTRIALFVSLAFVNWFHWIDLTAPSHSGTRMAHLMLAFLNWWSHRCLLLAYISSILLGIAYIHTYIRYWYGIDIPYGIPLMDLYWWQMYVVSCQSSAELSLHQQCCVCSLWAFQWHQMPARCRWSTLSTKAACMISIHRVCLARAASVD